MTSIERLRKERDALSVRIGALEQQERQKLYAANVVKYGITLDNIADPDDEMVSWAAAHSWPQFRAWADANVGDKPFRAWNTLVYAAADRDLEHALCDTLFLRDLAEKPK